MVSVRLNSLSVSDTDTHGEVVFSISGDQAIEAEWLDRNHLDLHCASCKAAAVNLEVVKAGEIYVTYGANLVVRP